MILTALVVMDSGSSQALFCMTGLQELGCLLFDQMYLGIVWIASCSLVVVLHGCSWSVSVGFETELLTFPEIENQVSSQFIFFRLFVVSSIYVK